MSPAPKNSTNLPEVPGQDSYSYHPELDVLRFVAFGLVFIHHGLPSDPSIYANAGLPVAAIEWLLAAKNAGAYGVDLFFTLSAYLITELLVREHKKRGRISVRHFYIRRALRIWPLYFAFLIGTVVFVPLIIPQDGFNWKYALSFALLSGNWACVIWGYPVSVATPLWSVSVEEQFYLAWPLLLLLLGVSRVRVLAITLLAVAFITRIILALTEVGHPGVWCNTLARLDPIALGALLAVGLRGRIPNLRWISRIGLCVGGLFLLLIVGKYLRQSGLSSLITFPVVALSSLMLLAGVLTAKAPIFQRAPFSVFPYLGRISYGLYVFHLLALSIMAQTMYLPMINLQMNFERRFIFAFLLTVALAAISYRWLETPFLQLKDRFTHVPSRVLPGSIPSQLESQPSEPEAGLLGVQILETKSQT